MYPTDPTNADSAAIIPFTPRDFRTDDGPSDEVSTIVAVVAVTLRHDSGMSPEEGLADLIEASGQAEIIEIQDACAEIFDGSDVAQHHHPRAVNDNRLC